MSEQSKQALNFIQQFSMKATGPTGQDFSQFNMALKAISQELTENEKIIVELTTEVSELKVEVKELETEVESFEKEPETE